MKTGRFCSTLTGTIKTCHASQKPVMQTEAFSEMFNTDSTWLSPEKISMHTVAVKTSNYMKILVANIYISITLKKTIFFQISAF
jgi:hypothetical protein